MGLSQEFPSSKAGLEAYLETQRMSSGLPEFSGKPNQLPSGYLLVNRYLVEDVIGIGGMGSVYRARDLHFPNVVKLVAVKEMINQAPDPLVRETIVHNFEREANILATLNHPAIPKIFDYFSHAERSYLVLEYINGKDLEAILHDTNAPLPEEQVVAWSIEICDVLDFLHNHRPEPIIFRDMKPSNVMVNQQNHIVLIDFGIAKLFRSGQKGTMIGTEGYSPPEQYRGEASQQADLYALGATLHHLLTNKDPRLETPFSFDERPVRKINPGISPELERVLTTALKYDASSRYPSAAAMKDALVSVARRTGILSRINVSRPVNDTQIKPVWTFRCEDEIRGGPAFYDGHVLVGAYDNNVYALKAAGGEFAWKLPTEGGIVTRPVVDDGLVMFGSEDKVFYAAELATGRVQWRYDTSGPIRSSGTIYEGHVFFGSDDGYLHAVQIATGTRLWRCDTSSPIRSTPAMSGDKIYTGNEGGDFLCIDLKGQTRWRFHAKRAIVSTAEISDGIAYFGSVDGNLYAVDAKSGWAVWRFRMAKGTVSSPCNSEHLTYIGSADGNIYCVDSVTSKEVWRFTTEHQVSGSPIIHNGALYCGSADGCLYSLDARNGRIRWKFSTDGPITGRPVIHDDVLYIGSSDHVLYALMT